MASLSSWSDLPPEMLELIFDCAKDLIDILRCGAACKSWLPTALQVYKKFLPLCFILTGKVEDSTRVLFNLLTKESIKIHLPEAKGNWICSCSQSWLLIFDSTEFPYRMQLLNIFSRTQIDLPPIFLSPLERLSLDPITRNITRFPFNWKLLLSQCPLNSDCILFFSSKTPTRYHPGNLAKKIAVFGQLLTGKSMMLSCIRVNFMLPFVIVPMETF